MIEIEALEGSVHPSLSTNLDPKPPALSEEIQQVIPQSNPSSDPHNRLEGASVIQSNPVASLPSEEVNNKHLPNPLIINAVEKLINNEISEDECLALIKDAIKIVDKNFSGYTDKNPQALEQIQEPNRYAILVKKMKGVDKAVDDVRNTLADIREARETLLAAGDLSQTFLTKLDKTIQNLENFLKYAEAASSEPEMRSITQKLAKEGMVNFYINTINSSSLHRHLGYFDYYLQLRFLLSDVNAFLDKPGNLNLTEKQRKTLENFKENLTAACAIMEYKSRTPKDLRVNSGAGDLEKNIPLEHHMRRQIENLSVGESCFFAGGGKNHAFVYEVVKLDDTHYSFTVINTGEDESKSRISKKRNRSALYKARHDISSSAYEHLSYKMPLSALSPQFLKSISLSTTTNTPTPQVIGQISNHLDHQKDVVRQRGRLHQPQNSTNCTAKSLMSLLHGDLMRNLGETEGKALFLQIKKFRGQRNYHALIELLDATPSAALMEIYEEVSTDQELKRELELTHREAQSVVTRWSKKAAKTAPNLKAVEK